MKDRGSALEKLTEAFPFLKDAGFAVKQDVRSHAMVVCLPEGHETAYEVVR
ncbi:MAG: hypothetical protein JSU90_11260 [Nitrospiraceae bacterium]|nr:MAG: hypothetical protein JSU90_11260 [Nitrospiraceae bacterium]